MFTTPLSLAQFTSLGQIALIGIPGCAAIYVFFKFLRPVPSTLPYPPGPKPLPLLGNLLDVPLKRQWLVYSQWAKRYGRINSFTIIGQRLVVINSLEVARDILSNRSAVYSDRPPLIMGGELCGWSRLTVLTPYGNALKEHRSIFSRGISTKRTVEKYHSVMESTARSFAKSIASDSSDLIGQIHRSIANMSLLIIYGYNVQDRDDPLVRDTEKIIDFFTQILEPGAYLVDTLPFLKHLPEWFPGAGFQKTAKFWRAMITNTCDALFEHGKLAKGQGNREQTCIAGDALEENEITPEMEEYIKWSTFTLFAAAIDTTSSVLSSFFLAMTTYPVIYEKAREELSKTLGEGVLPTMDDCSRLSYLAALVKETIRWGAVGPLGVPHATVEDDVYKEYFIPKGAVVLVNVWGICNDPDVYANPDEFRPERFMGEKPEPDPEFMFGFGRRKCPGMNFALQYLTIACATSLVSLDISKATDEFGAVLEPGREMVDRVINLPKPFPCKIRRRC